MYDVATEGIVMIFRTIDAYSSVQQKMLRETVETFSYTSHLFYDPHCDDSLSNTDLSLLELELLHSKHFFAVFLSHHSPYITIMQIRIFYRYTEREREIS